MAVNLYKGFTNTITGETFRCISYTEKIFTCDWMVQPGGYVPFEHIHLAQDEIFHVKKGELRIIIDSREFIVGEGQSVTVPQGAQHIAYNNKPVLLHCEIKYIPGLDNYRFFQCFGGLTIDNDMSKNGTVNIPKMLYFSKKMKAQCIARPSKIPPALFSLAMRFSYIMGTVLGWKKLYNKYTG